MQLAAFERLQGFYQATGRRMSLLAGISEFVEASGKLGGRTMGELLKRLPVSRRTLFSWRTTGKIPFVRLGGRRILFHWPAIEAALLRMQTGGVQ